MSYTRIPEPALHSQPQHPPESIPMKNFFANPEPDRIRPKMTPLRRRKLLISYAPDWIITILLAAAFFSLDKVEGYRRSFSLDDTSLRHTYAVHERVPNNALLLICFIAPLVLQPLINLLTIRSWWDLHNGTLGLVLSLATTGSFTQFIKITVGRPRPDILDRCQPPPGASDPPFGLSVFTICTQTDNGILRDGFRSFPSGHASLSFAGLGFFSFYIAGKLHLFDRKGHAGKAWISLFPFAGAALVAISRTMDYRHHWHDVLVGSILGTVLAYFSYRQYYPGLGSEYSHRPYSPRIKREEDHHILPTHNHAHAHAHTHQHQHSNAGHAAPFTFTPPQPYADHRIEQDYELEGTVLRPDPGPLEEVWKRGDRVTPSDGATSSAGQSTDKQSADPVKK